jgi:hypothetical protein
MWLLHLGMTAQAADCALEEADYYEIRTALRELRLAEGGSVGVMAEGPACGRALDSVIRNGPFLGVHRVEGVTPEDPCVAVLQPGPRGWALGLAGECRSMPATGPVARITAEPAVPQSALISTSDLGPSRIVSFAWWLPYGVSVRLDQDLGRGVSALVDYAWHPPRLWSDQFDFGDTLGPTNVDTSTMRFLGGFDLTHESMRGTFFGARAGVEASTPPEGMLAQYGIVSFVAGRKWIGTGGVTAQLGGGVIAEIPIGLGPTKETLGPVAELRLGFANRR